MSLHIQNLSSIPQFRVTRVCYYISWINSFENTIYDWNQCAIQNICKSYVIQIITYYPTSSDKIIIIRYITMFELKILTPYLD